jgi:hypothetical protein
MIDRAEGAAGRVKGVAKILTFAPLTEARFYLGILICKILAQKLILLRGHLRRRERDL